jgi:hypothetical protein
MQIIKKSIFLLIIFFSFYVSAEVEVKGIATYQYSSSSPGDKELKEAQSLAKNAAWKTYTSKFNAAKMKQFMLVEEEINQKIDDYIISSVLVENQVDKDNKSITSIVKIKINEVALDAKLSTLSAAGQASSGEGNNIVFVFASRQLESSKNFNTKETKIKEEKSAKKITDSMAGDTDAVTSESFEKSTTGGSNERKSDQIKYKSANNSISAKDIDSAMKSVLSPMGFEVSIYDDIVSYCGGVERMEIEKEFINSNDISRKSRKSAIDASRGCEVKFFSVGTLDVGIGEKDPVTGDTVVTVSVRAEVDDISKKIPKNVASIGPIQASGNGVDEQTAAREALKSAAIEAAKSIVDQLNAKGIN